MIYKSKYSNILTKKFLIKEYIKNKKSIIEIAKNINCEPSTGYEYLKKYNIRIRTISEALRGKINNKGKNNSNYIDGRKSKIHYCIEPNCNNKISYQTWNIGQGRCFSCAAKLRWQDEEYRENFSKKIKQLWQTLPYRKKVTKAILKGMKLTPNKKEKLLNKLINKTLPNEYKFVGNGKVIINGFCPDFINKDNSKIIEFFGCYWHKCKQCGFGKTKLRSKDVGRLKTYRKYGYKILIIWEHELKNWDKVKKKILNFNKKEK